MHKHIISTKKITLSDLREIHSNKDLKLELSEESKALIQKCRDYLDQKTANQKEPIYGITTGFGSLCNISISVEDLSQLQKNLVMSHACGTGDEVSQEIVRLMLFLKAHAISLGNSGVQLITVQRIVDFFNEGIYPVVYELGSLGASGDLAPLAHLFLPLLGLGEVNYKGERFTGAEILAKFGWEPITLQSKEGLALLNGTQFMSSHGVDLILRAERIVKIADITGALSLEGYDGRKEPFYPSLHTIRPHQGQIDTAQAVRDLLAGSELIEQKKVHVQDPYSFRCMPQVHGASKDAIDYVTNKVIIEINSVTDNPTVFPDEDLVLSGGNFHGQHLALAYDFLSIAMAELGNISERRVYRLIAGERKLPSFLVANPGLNSGFMIPQYSAAAIVSQNKQLCTPSSIDSISSSNEQEDHVSMGANGATKALRVAKNVERLLGIEMFTATQAIEFRRPLKSSDILEKYIAAFREKVEFVKDDKVMYTEIEKSTQFIKEYNF